MAGQTLAEVSVEVLADLRRLKPATIVAAKEAGEKGGDALGDGLTRGASEKLEGDKGRFAGSGKSAAAKFAKGFEGELSGGGTFAKTAATMASRFALMGGAAAAAAPGVGQLTAALVPAAGAALALPAAMLAIRAASGTVKVAVMGVGDAITAGFGDNAKKADKALNELSGSARVFAKSIIGLRPQVEGLQKAVSDRFFRPFADDVRPLAELYLPMLRSEMGDLAGPLGGLAEQLAETGKRGLIFDTVRKVFESTRMAAINVRGAIDPLAWSLALLVKDTVGELPGLASGFANASERFADFVAHASETGAITQAFRNGIATLKDFGGILRNLGSIVASVYSAATANGNTLLANLRDLTGQAAAFFKSAEGGAALAAVFGTLGTFGEALKSSLGAALPAIAKSVEALGPALAGLADPAAQLIIAVAPLLPLLAGITAQVVQALTPAIAVLSKFLAQNETVVKGLLVTMVAYRATMIAAAAITAVQAAGGILAWAKGLQIATVATRAAAAANIVFGAALRFAMGPVGLIITGIGLLAAAVIYLWKNNQTFRTIVVGAWNGVKTAVSAVVGWFTGTALPWLQKVWKGIADGAVAMWQNGIRPAVQALVSFWQKVLVPAAQWLYRTILRPTFMAIAAVVKAAMAVAELAIKIWVTFLRAVVAPAVLWLYRTIIKPTWDGVVTATRNLSNLLQAAFRVFTNFLRGTVGPAITWLWRTIIQPAWNGVRTATSTLTQALRTLFSSFTGFLKNNVVGAFRTSVSAIQAAWNKLREAARVPVQFVVNSVINPLINGFNKIAGTFNTKQIDTIKGFAGGGMPGFDGRIPGNSGGVDDRRGGLFDRAGKFLGSIKVASGEFIVNAKDTAKALPLLRWINDGMKGGPLAAAQRIGRPAADRPGDGSEGWAFAKGGLAGFFDNVWDTVTNPKKALLGPVNALIGKIPGGGAFRDILAGMARKLTSGIADWLTGSGGGTAPGNVGKAQSFIRAQAGKPYVWASAGPRGYDCSGIVSAAWNILHGRSPYSHTFSTGSLPGKFFPKSGFGGPLTAGWAHPGQKGASANVGHMAGQFIGGMKFESTGSRGVRVGAAARSPLNFAHVGHFAGGGIAQVARADFGSVTLARGWNMIENRLGRPEHLTEKNGAVGGGAVRLHPADLESLGRIIGREIAAGVGAGNYAAGRNIGLYTRGG